MSRELVGLQNLPNAYIKEIRLTDLDETNFEISVSIVVKDYFTTNYIWSSDKMLSNMLDVGLICTSNSSVIENLTNGSLSPLDKSLTEMLKSAKVKNKEPTTTNVDYIHYFKVSYPKTISNLSLFAFCFLGSQTIKIHGPIKSEKVFENFQLADKTKIFSTSDGSLWPGPVHLHGNKYMAGSFHTTKPHPSLLETEIKNFKIKNLTSKIKKPVSIKRTKASPFSNLYTSVDSKTNFSGIFAIDVKNILINNTTHGKFLYNTSSQALNAILKKFRITSLIVQRQRVETTDKGKVKNISEVENISYSYDNLEGILKNFTRIQKMTFHDVVVKDLPSSTNTQNMNPKKIYKEDVSESDYISEIQEMFLSSNPQLRYFQFNDYSYNEKTPGIYRYKVYIKFYDPTLDFMDEINNTLLSDLSKLNMYYFDKSKNKNYDFEINQSKMKEYTVANLSDIVKNYIIYYSYINDVAKLNLNKMFDELYSLVSPQNSTLGDTKRFLKKYENLQSDFYKIMSYDGKKKQNKVGRFSLKNNSYINEISVFKQFDNNFIPSDNFQKLNYLSKESTLKLKILTKGNYNSRVQKEINKFYSSSPNFNTSENAAIDPNVLSSLSNISHNSSQFLSPVGMGYGEVQQDLSRIENIDIKQFNKILQQNSTQTMENKYTIAKIVDYKQPDSIEQFITIGKVLGDNSEQNSTITNESSENEIPDELLASIGINNSFLDLNSKDFIKEDFNIASPKFSLNAEHVLNLPMQTKAVLGSKLNSTNNAILDSNGDALANPNTRNLINLNFLGVQQVEYLEGFQTTKDGFKDLSQPIWKKLSSKKFQDLKGPTLCRLVLYSNDLLGINLNYKKLPSIVDSLFVISDTGVGKKMSFQNLDLLNGNSLETATYEYTNSNIVVQTHNRVASSTEEANVENRNTLTLGNY